MIAMIGLLDGGIIIGLLNRIMVIKNRRHRKQRLSKSSYLSLGTHQDIGICICQKMRKKRQKNYGSKQAFLYLATGYKKFFDLKKEQQIKMSSAMNVSNASSKPEEFNLKDIGMLVDSEEQNCFKRAHVGKFLGLSQIENCWFR